MKEFLAAVLLVITHQLPSLAQWTPELEAGFQQRKQEYLEKFESGDYGSNAYEYEKHSYPKAMIDFLKGNRERAIAFLQSEDLNADKNAHTLGIDFYSGFTLKGQVRKYFYFGSYLAPSYRQRMREAIAILTDQDPLTRQFPQPRKFWERSTDNCKTWVDCRNTDNLKAMRDVSIYLFAEETGNEATRQIYKQRIYRTVRTLYEIGQGEWDSETYMGHSITTYVNLYDFAKDPDVKQYAKAALDWLLTAGALKYWRGGFGGPSKRDYGGGNCTWCSLTSHALGLYFGDSPIPDPNPDPDIIHLITSNYRPDKAVVALARKNFQKPMELLNSKPTYENWKPGGDSQPQFHETLYFGDTFQLGTLAQGSGGDWNGFKMMAFNERQGVDYFIAATGDSPNISTSSDGNNAVGQYRNLVIWLNDKPKVQFQFSLPKSAQVEFVNRDWGLGTGDWGLGIRSRKQEVRKVIFIQYEKTWLALIPINLDWQSTKLHDQILTIRSDSNSVNGFALEVGEARTHHTWEQFKRLVLINSRLKFNGDTAEYFSSKNSKLKVQHQGEKLPNVWRNGYAHSWQIHLDVYRNDVRNLNKSPVYQGWKSGKLEVFAGGYYFKSQLP